MRRSSFIAGFAACLSVVLAALVLCHSGLEALSLWAESKPGVYLWRHADDLLLLSPSRFRHSGRGRVMIFGASEAAEGFLDETIRRRLPRSDVDNLAFDGATFNDFVVQLQYLDTVYGHDAFPENIVVGLTPRFLANTLMENPRFFRDQIAAYSPAEARGGDPAASVVKKTTPAAFVAWLRFRLHQTERYQGALRVAAVEIAGKLHPGGSAERNLRSKLLKAKYRLGRPTQQAIREGLVSQRHWQLTHTWKASDHRAMVQAEIDAVNRIARRNQGHIWFVNMPVLPMNLQMFSPGVYEDYLQVMNSERGDAKFLDLGEFLSAGEFEGTAHASEKGAARISIATVDAIRKQQLHAEAIR